ncbi:MAG: hypothetical protein JKX69_07970 [Rhodobacteraceae bacterium]|nr:hypothetical protein [Paracoccaceae bacterium]
MDLYEDRLQKANDELARAGIWASNANPPYTKMLRQLGLKPRPPHYVSFWEIVIVQGILFGVLWGIIIWLSVWSVQGVAAIVSIIAAFSAGALFGFCMALYYRYGRKRYGLRTWEAL